MRSYKKREINLHNIFKNKKRNDIKLNFTIYFVLLVYKIINFFYVYVCVYAYV